MLVVIDSVNIKLSDRFTCTSARSDYNMTTVDVGRNFFSKQKVVASPYSDAYSVKRKCEERSRALIISETIKLRLSMKEFTDYNFYLALNAQLMNK